MRKVRKEFHFSDEDLKDLDYDVFIGMRHAGVKNE